MTNNNENKTLFPTCFASLEDLKKYLLEKKQWFNTKKNDFVKLYEETKKEKVTPTHDQWKEMYYIATRPGNQLTEYEMTLLPGEYYSDFDTVLFSDDSDEIIEPPVFREVVNYYNENKIKIEKMVKELDNIDWESLDNNSQFLEEIENRFFEEIQGIEVCNNKIEEIDKEISSRKGKIALILGITNLPHELRIEVAIHYNLINDEENALNELEEVEDRFDIKNQLPLEELQEIINSKKKEYEKLTPDQKLTFEYEQQVNRAIYEKLASNYKKEISRFIYQILDKNFEEYVETKWKEGKRREQSQFLQEQHIQLEQQQNNIYEILWENTGLKNYLSLMTYNKERERITNEKSIKRLVALKNNLNWWLEKEKWKLTQIQTELHQKQFENYSLKKIIVKNNEKIKIKSDKNIELIKKLWDVQQELKDKETTIAILTVERNNLQTQLETVQQELAESKHLVVEEQEKLRQQKEHCERKKKLWEELSAKQKLEAQEVKEKEIVDKLIKELGLYTREREREREREHFGLEAVITEIKNKLTPPTDNNDSKIRELEQEIINLKNHKQPISELANKTIVKSKQLGIVVSDKYAEKLKNSSNYQELFDVYSQATKEKLDSINNEKKTAQNLNYWLGALSVSSLLILAFMIIRMKKRLIKKKAESMTRQLN